MPWSSWNFKMTVDAFVKTSMLGSVLSESLTDSTAFRKCLVGGLPRHHTQTFASKPSVSSANSCLGQGGNADMRITRLFETVCADEKFAERGLRKNPGFLAVVHSSAPRNKGRSDGRVEIRITSCEY